MIMSFCSQASTQDELWYEISIKMNRGCGCVGFNHFACLDVKVIYDHILCIREPTKAEYDIYLMGKLTVNPFTSAAE